MSVNNRSQRRVILGLVLGFAALVIPLGDGPAAQPHAWTYADSHPAQNPLPWACGGADPGAQLIKQEHGNWHCTWGNGNTPEWGAAFVGFHRQFIVDYDVWRLGLGGDRVEIWDYGPGAIIPGDDETTSTPFTHCPEFPGSFRPAGAICNGCMALPNSLNVVNIGAYQTMGHAGAVLNSSGWHGSFHIAAGQAGGACNEVASTASAPRDPIFWMGHKKVDDVARTWQRQKAADIVVVIDRSGSMNNDCDDTADCGGPNDPGDTSCRLNAAKNAALLLADLLDDAGVDGNQHRIGLVSFANSASQDVGLTNASGVVTDNGNNDTPYEIAIANMEACGATSIGDGIQKAIDMLNNTGVNPHQAILVLTDGMQNVGPDIDDVAGNLGWIQVCAVGIGTGGNESDLRSVAENHGGIFIAQEDLDSTTLTLEKFFVDCFAQIFDEVINEDPHFRTWDGMVSYGPIYTEVLPATSKLMFASGFRPPAGQEPNAACRLQWLVTSPGGDLVRAGHPQVETGQGPQWAHQRVHLPYMGQQQGRWTARLIRPQRIFFHGFPTDSYDDQDDGTSLVREEIHRLLPGGGQNVLYYEDGNLTGFSAYEAALAKEVDVGLIQNVVRAGSAAEFHSLLLQDWDLIVFARQLDASPQVFDSRLAATLCRIRRGLVTDLFSPAGAVNELYACVGLGAEPGQYDLLQGDGQLVVDPIALVQRPYQAPYLYLFPAAGNEPLLAQGFDPAGLPILVGTGTNCGPQEGFYTSHTAGVGLVEPANIRPRVLVGQQILATFEMTELNRPIGGWDAVQASVEVDEPGIGGVTIYPLYDDGTNGDKAIGNNTWTVLVPAATTQSGPHILRGIFNLTLGGQTVRREAEYSVIVENEPEPEFCTEVACNEEFAVAAGWNLEIGPCIGNMCLEERSYVVVADADRPWLCIDDGSGELVSVGAQYQFDTPPVMPGQPTCFSDEGPLYLCVPPEASLGDMITILVEVYDPSNPGLPPQTCRTVYTVIAADITPVDDVPQPASFALLEARPNPFNPATEIAFTLPGMPGQSQQAVLRIFDARGQLVRTLVDDRLAAGSHRVVWDGRDASGRVVSAGVYLYQLQAAGQSASGKMVMLK